MCKALLQYIILGYLSTAVLLYLTMPSAEVREFNESTILFMERLREQKSKKVQGSPEIREIEQNGTEETSNAGSVTEHQLNSWHTVCDKTEKGRQATEMSSETDVQNTSCSRQHFSVDVCLLFICHILSRSKKIYAETFITTSALLVLRASALPLDCCSSDDKKRRSESATNMDVKRKRKSRNAPTEIPFFQGDCEKDWFQNEDNCYRLFKEQMSHKSASQHCNSFSSKLATLKTEGENSFVQKFSNELHKMRYLWTGVEKLCRNCSETGSYVNWSPGQPDHDSSCVVMVSTGQWKDFDCRYLFAFVCEKAVDKPPYTRQQLLIAFLVPIFSCLTVAGTFTVALLINSFQRGKKPFKISSRYGRTRKQRRIATWDMLDSLRRASLTRRGSKAKARTRGSIPGIEISSEPETDKSETDGQNGVQKNKKKSRHRIKKPWQLSVPNERRRSSETTSNSSLYELLVRLNRMDFDATRDNQREIGDDGRKDEATNVKQESTETVSDVSNGGPNLVHDKEQLIEKHRRVVEGPRVQESSFKNMAFRDSAVSVQARGTAVIYLEQGRETSTGNSVVLEDTGENSPDQTHDPSSQVPENTCGTKECPTNGLDSNTKTVKVDVHRISEVEDSRPAKPSTETNGNKLSPCKGELVWTYSV